MLLGTPTWLWSVETLRYIGMVVDQLEQEASWRGLMRRTDPWLSCSLWLLWEAQASNCWLLLFFNTEMIAAALTHSGMNTWATPHIKSIPKVKMFTPCKLWENDCCHDNFSVAAHPQQCLGCFVTVLWSVWKCSYYYCVTGDLFKAISNWPIVKFGHKKAVISV